MFFFFQAEDGIRDVAVTGVQTCALPISRPLLQPDDETRGALTRHRRLLWRPARARAIWHEQGALHFGRRTLAFAWRPSLRHVLPTRRSFYWSGVRVLEDRALDDWFLPDRYPRQPVDIPNYEE